MVEAEVTSAPGVVMAADGAMVTEEVTVAAGGVDMEDGITARASMEASGSGRDGGIRGGGVLPIIHTTHILTIRHRLL
jgi:hypothetical protein